jgi:hypothetical protein
VSQVPEDIHWSREAIHSRTFLAQNLGLSHCAVNQSAEGAGSVREGIAQPAVPAARFRPHALRPVSAPRRGGGGAPPSSTRLPTPHWPYHRGGRPEAGRVLPRNRTPDHRGPGAEIAALHPRPPRPHLQTLSTSLSIANWLAAARHETAPPAAGRRGGFFRPDVPQIVRRNGAARVTLRRDPTGTTTSRSWV